MGDTCQNYYYFFLMSGGAHEYVAKINGKYRGLT